MNLEELEKSGYIIYEHIAGSHLYGLNVESSDIDTRGVYILPLQERLSIVDFDQEINSTKQDLKYYDIKKFIKLASDCNPALIESLWVPEDCMKICKPPMRKLIKNRDIFISRKAYHTFSGYSFSQISKCKGQNKMVHNPKPQDPPKKEDFCWFIPSNSLFFKNTRLDPSDTDMPARPIPLKNVIESGRIATLDKYHCAALEHVSNTFRLYYYGDQSKGVFRGNDMLVCENIPIEDEWNKFVGLLIYNQHEYEKSYRDWKNYWTWMKEKNPARWTDQQNKTIDYDAKNMLHCFRLLYSGKNILEFGFPIVRFEGKKREFLMDIRRNKFSYEYLMELVEQEMKELDELKEKSTLPWGCDVKKVNELYLEIIQ